MSHVKLFVAAAAMAALPACFEEAPATGERAELAVVKVVLCHIPPGNPANAHTIEVGTPAVNAHLAHGDLLGPCGQVCAADGAACTVDSDCCGDSCIAGTCRPFCTQGEVATEACGGSQAGVGACTFGRQTCNATGTGWGACEGAIGPVAETCDGIDNDCDGVVDNGCLVGLAWNDIDRDGGQDAEDGGPLGGVKIVLRRPPAAGEIQGAELDYTFTAKDGSYTLDGVLPGTYVLEVYFTGDWTLSEKDSVQDDTLDSDFYWGAGDWGETEPFAYDGAPLDFDVGLSSTGGI